MYFPAMTIDAILNIVLGAGIPGVMAIAAVIMSLRPSPVSRRERAVWLTLFVVLFVASLCAASWHEIRVTQQQQNAQDQADKRENEAKKSAEASEKNRIGDTQYMKGKLDTMSVVLGSVANRSPGSGDANLASALAQFAKQSPEETLAKRRADAQAHLGKLLSEGRQLSECLTAKDGVLPTETQKRAHDDWAKRTYAALAAEVDPVALPRFGGGYQVSVAPGQEQWLKTLCWATRLKVGDLEGIMADEFAPPITEAERQRREQAQRDIGKVLSTGESLYNKYCLASPQRTADVETGVENAIENWKSTALSVVTGRTGARGMEIWDESGNAYADTQNIQQKCGDLNMRVFALRNIIRACFRAQP